MSIEQPISKEVFLQSIPKPIHDLIVKEIEFKSTEEYSSLEYYQLPFNKAVFIRPMYDYDYVMVALTLGNLEVLQRFYSSSFGILITMRVLDTAQYDNSVKKCCNISSIKHQYKLLEEFIESGSLYSTQENLIKAFL